MLTKTLSEAKKKQRTSLIKAMNNDIGSIDSAKDSWNPAQISERAKDISYIRSLVDSWNPAQLNEALKMLDLPVIDTWNPAQIEEQRRNLVFYLAERTLTGNPITLKILGNLTPEVTGLKVTMNPIQIGSGDPSPTNIRPIIGRTELNVTRTAGEDAETKTHEYSETIYGGSDDFVNGGVTINTGFIEFDGSNDESWTYQYECFNIIISDSLKIQTPLCNTYVALSSRNLNTLSNGECAFSNTGANYFNIKTDVASDVASFRTWLSSNHVVLVYKLATPTTISTTPEEITLLKGTNVLSTDGDSIELKYKQNF